MTRTSIRHTLSLTTCALAALVAVATPASAATAPHAAVQPRIHICPSPGQVFHNTGFEAGASHPYWSASNGVISQWGPVEPARSGTWVAWLDGMGTTHFDTLSQTAGTVSGCATTLSFWLHIDTDETTTTTAFDTLTISVNGVTQAVFSNLDHNDGYAYVSILLSGVVGSATVKFVGAEDLSQQTSFVIDDTALTLS